jgi:DNA-directed RNA polymerase subunit RPC12/RpoP
MTKAEDIRIVALKCPNCGGLLRASPGSDHTQCEHCGGTVLIVDTGTEGTRVDATHPDTPEAAAARRRVVKIVLWGTMISVAIPIVATVIILIGVVFAILGAVFLGISK